MEANVKLILTIVQLFHFFRAYESRKELGQRRAESDGLLLNDSSGRSPKRGLRVEEISEHHLRLSSFQSPISALILLLSLIYEHIVSDAQHGAADGTERLPFKHPV